MFNVPSTPLYEYVDIAEDCGVSAKISNVGSCDVITLIILLRKHNTTPNIEKVKRGHYSALFELKPVEIKTP
jgi:hypothetical protein